jgi:hypothetical protein
MAIRTYLYQGSAGITASDLIPLLALGAAPVVQVPSQFGFLPITVDDSHKMDLDAAMADLGYAYVGEYTGIALPGTVKDYGSLSSNPGSLPPSAGDIYYHSILQMRMCYDSFRSKWLSVESDPFLFGRDGVTAPDQYYRSVDGRILSDSVGWRMGYPGTVVSLQYTRTNADPMVFDLVKSGVSIGTFASLVTSGGNNLMNFDFGAGDILAVKNQAGGSSSQNVVAWLRVKWRSP